MADKVQVTDSLASLELEGKPGPYVLGVPRGKVTFPDPAEMDFQMAEDFLADLATTTSPSEAIRRWLSPEDWEKFVEAKPNLGQVKVLATRLQQHYSYIFGTPGEGSASATS